MTDTQYPYLRSDDGGIRVRFDPGFGLNVYIESWVPPASWDNRKSEKLRNSLAMSIIGWENVCKLVHEWEAWDAEHQDRYVRASLPNPAPSTDLS